MSETYCVVGTGVGTVTGMNIIGLTQHDGHSKVMVNFRSNLYDDDIAEVTDIFLTSGHIITVTEDIYTIAEMAEPQPDFAV